MKVVLEVLGREIVFSKKQLIAMAEKEAFSDYKKSATGMSETPCEGKWFQVDPLGINQEIFKEARVDKQEENIRKIILDAFDELNSSPEKYGRKFKTMIPEKFWSGKTLGEIQKLVSCLGDHMADWVEQSLEWAQRIANGESWEQLCKQPDVAKYYRFVIWKDDVVHLVGGGKQVLNGEFSTASVEEPAYLKAESKLENAVPLVVDYE